MIETWTGPTDNPSELDQIVQAARTVLDLALAPDLRDDRFSEAWARSLAGSDLRVAIGRDEAGKAIAYVGGAETEDVVQLDALVAQEVPEQADTLRACFDAIAAELASAKRLELWAKPAVDFHGLVAAELGLEPLRALHQMRCTLPVDFEAVSSRSFIPGQDEDALLRVNNRAFASHPDQGNMTRDDLASAAAEPWFNPEGIRLHEVDGEVAGFCWTKIHDEPRVGEIYAIGIDPDHHGKGLGVPMTTAGLAWMADQGLTTGMLYVEADNEPALRTYDRLGFTILRTDRAWLRPAS